MRLRDLLLLTWLVLPATALAGAFEVRGDAAATWADAARFVDLQTASLDIRLTVQGATTEIAVIRGGQVVRTQAVATPSDESGREEVLFIALSLTRELSTVAAPKPSLSDLLDAMPEAPVQGPSSAATTEDEGSRRTRVSEAPVERRLHSELRMGETDGRSTSGSLTLQPASAPAATQAPTAEREAEAESVAESEAEAEAEAEAEPPLAATTTSLTSPSQASQTHPSRPKGPWMHATGTALLHPGRSTTGGAQLGAGWDTGVGLRIGLTAAARSPSRRSEDTLSRPAWEVPLALRVAWAPHQRIAPRLGGGVGVSVRHFRQDEVPVATRVMPTAHLAAALTVRAKGPLRLRVGAVGQVDLGTLTLVEPDNTSQAWPRWSLSLEVGIELSPWRRPISGDPIVRRRALQRP